MPWFDYTASDRDGTMDRGRIEAADRGSASRELLGRGLFVLDVAPSVNGLPLAPVPDEASTESGTGLVPHPKALAAWDQDEDNVTETVAVDHKAQISKAIPASESPHDAGKNLPEKLKLFSRPQTWSRMSRALYLRQMQVMFDAGIPLYRAASVLGQAPEQKETVNEKLREIPLDLERGRVLSKALERSGLFNKLIVNSVRLGEESGRLDSILEALSTNEERGVQLTRALVSRLTYPLVVLISMTGGLVVLGHVMSRVMSDLPAFQNNAPPILKIFSKILQHWSFFPLILLLLMGLAALARAVWRHDEARKLIEQSVFGLPMVGPLLKRLEANTVTGHLSLLLTAGLPLDRGLGLCAELVRTRLFSLALLKGQESLRGGAELTQSLQSATLFPEDVLALVHAGELSGSLEHSLSTAAKYCAEEVERTLEMVLAVLEPLLVGFLGIMIGIVLLLTFVPIFSSLKDL